MNRIWILLIITTLLYTCDTSPSYETIDGILEVPENRSKPNSRNLKLVYKILKAKKPDSLKAPIVFLQGGPGAATLIAESLFKNHSLRNDRDIVLMDQRGTGESEANCSDFGKKVFDIMRKNLDLEGEIKAMNTIMSECKSTMKTEEVDLSGYSSKENAADFEDLRKALGYDKWNLFGGSYGSRLGLTIMRDHPNGVRSAVLSAILAPETNLLEGSISNFENSLFSILKRCEDNQECNSRFPKLKERLINVLKKLQSEPLHLSYKDEDFTLNSQDALFMVFMYLYERKAIANIPLLIEALEQREIEPLISALQSVEFINDFVNWPMNYSVTAYEELAFNDSNVMDDALEQSEIGFVFPHNSLSTNLLRNWHSFRASDYENQPVVSGIPTLITSGGLDHVTPVSNATEALKHLKNSYEVIFLDEAHASLYNACFYQIVEDFINNPYGKPDVECSLYRNPLEWNLSDATQ